MLCECALALIDFAALLVGILTHLLKHCVYVCVYVCTYMCVCVCVCVCVGRRREYPLPVHQEEWAVLCVCH